MTACSSILRNLVVEIPYEGKSCTIGTEYGVCTTSACSGESAGSPACGNHEATGGSGGGNYQGTGGGRPRWQCCVTEQAPPEIGTKFTSLQYINLLCANSRVWKFCSSFELGIYKINHQQRRVKYCRPILISQNIFVLLNVIKCFVSAMTDPEASYDKYLFFTFRYLQLLCTLWPKQGLQHKVWMWDNGGHLHALQLPLPLLCQLQPRHDRAHWRRGMCLLCQLSHCLCVVHMFGALPVLWPLYNVYSTKIRYTNSEGNANKSWFTTNIFRSFCISADPLTKFYPYALKIFLWCHSVLHLFISFLPLYLDIVVHLNSPPANLTVRFQSQTTCFDCQLAFILLD